MPPPSVHKLNALTSLRFFAAAMVVLLHASVSFKLPVDAWAPLALNNGVCFFFVLSGFILTYVYGAQPKLDRGRFLLARVARIWPAHIAALLLFLLLASPISWQQTGWKVWLANITLVHAWVPQPQYYLSFVSPSWSVSAELAFYLCFMFLVPRLKQTWPWKLGLTFGVLVLLWQLWRWLPASIDLSGDSKTWGARLVYFTPYARLFEFVLGMGTAVLWRQFSPKLKLGLMTGSLLEGAAIVLVLFTMHKAHSWSVAPESIEFIGKPGAVWLRSGGATCLAFAMLIFVMAQEQGILSRLLSHPFPVLLGEISYSIYLLHYPLLNLLERRPCWLAASASWTGFAVYSLATLAVAYLMWVLVECPCRRALISLWPKPATAKPQAQDPALFPRSGWIAWTSSWQEIAASSLILGGLAAALLLQTSSTRCEGRITMTTLPGQPYAGIVDRADTDFIAGWAWNSERPKEPVQVEIYDGKKLLLTVPACEHREDLVNHLGDCSHSFTIPTPKRFRDGRTHHLHVRIAQSSFELSNPTRGLKGKPLPQSVSQNTP